MYILFFTFILLFYPVIAYAALADNLISFWSLEEASGTRNDSHGTNHLSESASVGQVTGKVGNAGAFVATDGDHLWIANNSGLQTGDVDFTIVAWVYHDSLSDQMIYANGENQGPTLEFVLMLLSGANEFRFVITTAGSFDNTVTVQASNFGAISTGTWYFVVGWHDSVNNQIGISVNAGTPNTTAHSGGVFSGASYLRVGAWHNGASDLFMDGRIDQLGFWKRVLTSDERNFLYNSGNGRAYSEIVSTPTVRRATPIIF